MAGLINIGLSGVLGHQNALNTTGNNITNANTPGYSRQEVQFESSSSRYTTNGYVGTGVDIANIRRLAAQSLNNFFAAMQNAAEDPGSLPQRQLVLSEAQSVVNRFQALHQEFIQQRELVKTQMTESVADANTLIKNIAELNLAISESPGLAQGNPPNDLLDKRDEAIRKLSEIVNVRVSDSGAGQVNVSLANGQALVVGSDSVQLGTRRNADDPSRLEFTLSDGNRTQVIDEQITGGKLGGLRRFESEALMPAFDELGRVAVALQDTMNHQHQIGMDLEGDLGGLFFSEINSREKQLARVVASGNNTPPGDGVVSVDITDTSRLPAGSWALNITSEDGRSYELVDEDTGKVVNQGRLPTPLPAEINMPGFNVRVESGTFSEGDRFLIQPTRMEAANISLEVDREEDLAFASPVRAEADSGNSGDATINQGVMFDVRNPNTNAPLSEFSVKGELNPPLEVYFTADDQYEIRDPNGNVLETGTYQAGTTNKLFTEDPSDPNYRGFQFEISGNPQAGDSFSIGYNTDGSADNRNAEIMAGLATKNTMNEGSQSFTEGYAGLVEQVGVKTRQAQLDSESGRTLLEQSTNQRESVSGVNLDEEAGRLIQYQAAYNASAKVMGVAQELFATLLTTFR